MRKIFSIILLSVLTFSAVSLSSCKKEESAGEIRMVGFYITPRSTVVEILDTLTLTVWASYSDGSKVDVTSSSQITASDPSVAKIEDGKAVGLKEGRTTLKASLNDKTDTCSFTVSSIEKITLSIYNFSDTLFAYPIDEYIPDEIEVKAHFKSGDTKTVTPDTLISENPKKAEFKWKDGELQAFNIARITNDTTMVHAYYTSLDKNPHKAELLVSIANLDTVSFSLTDSKWDEEKHKFQYKNDTLKLGAESGIVAAVAFSWKDSKRKDTVEVLTYCDSIESKNPAVLGIVDGESVIANDTTNSATEDSVVYFTGKFFGKTVQSRPIVIVKDSTYLNPKYDVSILEEYAYVGDVITYRFVQQFDNGVEVDLTNTGNENIKSSLMQGIRYMTPTISSGVLQVDGIKDNGDSLEVRMDYYGEKIVVSKGIALYDQPSLKLSAKSDTIIINNRTTHLYKGKDDVCSIVDNTGKDWTESITITAGKKGYYYLPVVEDMSGRTLLFTYGPEERTVSVYVPVKQ